MGAMRRTVQFTKGGLFGAAIGAGAAMLLAPGSGDELRAALRDRVRRAKEAGEMARAHTERDLIAKYRGEVNDPTALAEEPAAPPTPIRS